jgi:methionine-rich copper-binding protein CopC
MPLKKLLVVALSTTYLFSGGAWAHAHLLAQNPAADGSVTAPQKIELVFSEGIEATFSQVDVTTATGQSVAAQPLKVTSDDRKTLVLELDAPLAAGDYRVNWRVRSVDTHKSAGSYRFTVGQ